MFVRVSIFFNNNRQKEEIKLKKKQKQNPTQYETNDRSLT